MSQIHIYKLTSGQMSQQNINSINQATNHATNEGHKANLATDLDSAIQDIILAFSISPAKSFSMLETMILESESQSLILHLIIKLKDHRKSSKNEAEQALVSNLLSWIEYIRMYPHYHKAIHDIADQEKSADTRKQAKYRVSKGK